jgi:RNA polymerase sigma-70 factor (ECF subfamily)
LRLGKLRSFLLVAVRNFLANEWRRKNRIKRGGGVQVLSFDWENAEKRACLEPVDALTPEVIFERHWAMTILRATLERLARSYREEKKEELYEHLSGYLEGNQGMPGYREVGERLGMTEAAVKQAVYKLRKRHRIYLLREVASTLQEGESAEEELRELLGVFG